MTQQAHCPNQHHEFVENPEVPSVCIFDYASREGHHDPHEGSPADFGPTTTDDLDFGGVSESEARVLDGNR